MRLRKDRRFAVPSGQSTVKCSSAATIMSLNTKFDASSVAPGRGVGLPRIPTSFYTLSKEKRIPRQRMHLSQVNSSQVSTNNLLSLKVDRAVNALRDRYNQRHNLHKIFSSWDQTGRGHLNADEVTKMLQAVGVPLQKEQVNSFIRNASAQKEECLRLQDFINLVHGKTIRVRELDQSQPKKEEDNQPSKRFKKHLMSLKSKIGEISEKSTGLDKGQHGTLSLKQFDNIVRMKLPKHEDSNKLIGQIFKQFQVGGHSIQYKKVLNYLRDYTIDISEEKAPENHLQLDLSKADFTQLQRHYLQSGPVKRILFNYFPTQAEFVHFFLPKGEQNIAFSTLCDRVGRFLSCVQEKGRSDSIAAFANLFQYNQNGEAKVQDVLDYLYGMTAQQYFTKIQQRPKGPPPYNSQLIQPTLDGAIKLPFLSPEPMLSKVRKMDPQRAGIISYDRARQFLTRSYNLQEEVADQIIRRCDSEGKGHLSINDIGRNLCQSGQFYSILNPEIGDKEKAQRSLDRTVSLRNSQVVETPPKLTRARRFNPRPIELSPVTPQRDSGMWLSEEGRFSRAQREEGRRKEGRRLNKARNESRSDYNILTLQPQ